MFGRWFKKHSLNPPPIAATPSEPAKPSEIYTSTATIVLFDLIALNHRIDDDVDWWADPAEEMSELNRRNLLILGLQSDGYYDVDITQAAGTDERSFSLTFSSGKVFVGPGEEITGGGNEPTGNHGGFFCHFGPGKLSFRGISR